MSLLKLIDDLPTDILFECAKYIYLPPNKLLQEIKHYGQVKVSIELLKYSSSTSCQFLFGLIQLPEIFFTW